MVRYIGWEHHHLLSGVCCPAGGFKLPGGVVERRAGDGKPDYYLACQPLAGKPTPDPFCFPGCGVEPLGVCGFDPAPAAAIQ